MTPPAARELLLAETEHLQRTLCLMRHNALAQAFDYLWRRNLDDWNVLLQAHESISAEWIAEDAKRRALPEIVTNPEARP